MIKLLGWSVFCIYLVLFIFQKTFKHSRSLPQPCGISRACLVPISLLEKLGFLERRHYPPYLRSLVTHEFIKPLLRLRTFFPFKWKCIYVFSWLYKQYILKGKKLNEYRNTKKESKNYLKYFHTEIILLILVNSLQNLPKHMHRCL